MTKMARRIHPESIKMMPRSVPKTIWVQVGSKARRPGPFFQLLTALGRLLVPFGTKLGVVWN